jgi:pimeloyl-ACP methyl ester carboxylesterase
LPAVRGSPSAPSFAEGDDGVRIRIHHLGGTGPPLLCVHATGFHGRVWEPFVPPLREHFSVIALDQRGHGDSDKPDGLYAWPKFGDDVLAVVGHLGLENPVGLGHSAGATALVFAESSRPGTFSRLVLMDPTLLPPEYREVAPGGFNPMSEQARRRRAVWDSHDEMIDRLRTGSPLAGWREDFLRAYVTYGTEAQPDGTVRLKCPPEIEAQVYATAPTNDGWDRLGDLGCPTLFLTGETSPMWSGDRGELAAARIPFGRWERIVGGHFFPMEQPDEASERSLRFLLDR